MQHLNIEIKAKSTNHDSIRKYLKQQNATFKGIDHQLDTYFNSLKGRLKLREGNIENYLIHYLRQNISGPKSSTITLHKSDPTSNLKEILTKALGILTIVDKTREIYFLENVKFHLDIVKGLGTFIEIEARDESPTPDKSKLLSQCNHYMQEFQIKESDLISNSYSDLMLEKQNN